PAADASGGVSGRDARPDAALCGALEVHVEREADRLARRRIQLRDRPRHRPPEGVDPDLSKPVLAAQIGVVACLDPALTDLVAEPVALAPEALVLVRGDQPDGAEHLCGERLIWVVPRIGGCQQHAGEVAGA